MFFYNASTNQSLSAGEIASLYGTVLTEAQLNTIGFYQVIDPYENESLEVKSLFQKNGYTKQGNQFFQSYVVSPTLIAQLTTAETTPPIPVGQIAFFAQSESPRGFLVCDGSVLEISSYSALFAYLGNLYGGDGVTTFAVPDLRGQFIRGWDAGAGVDPGRVFGSNQDDAFESHAHFMAGNLGAAGSRIVAGTPSKTPDYTSGAPTQVTGDTETRPKNVALLPCIFSGVFTPPPVPPAPTYYGIINTGRGSGLGPEDLNPSYFTSFNASTGLTEAETELYIPGTDTVISYDAGLPPPYIFDSLGDCFASGDYTVEIRITATGEVIGTFTCPLSGELNEDVSWGTAP